MTTITDEMVVEALRTFGANLAHDHSWPARAQAMRKALEAAEAARAKGEMSGNRMVDLPRSITLTPTIPEGFIPWHGGECPVAEGVVGDLVCRNGEIAKKYSLHICLWRHNGGANDIIAYRVHKPADFRLEAGKYYITATGERVGPMKPYKVFHGFHADNSAGWWDSDGKGRTTENGSAPDIVALAADQGEAP